MNWKIKNLVLTPFGKFLIEFSTKVNLLFSGSEFFSSAADKAELFSEVLFESSNLDDSVNVLLYFSSGTNLKLHIIPARQKILIFPVWNEILKIWDTLFELIQIEVQCSKNYFKILSQEAGASGKTDIYREYCFCLQPNASVRFLQTCINFEE